LLLWAKVYTAADNLIANFVSDRNSEGREDWALEPHYVQLNTGIGE